MSKHWFKRFVKNSMSNTGKHAKRELEILEKITLSTKADPMILQFKDEIIALCDKFGKSGQSGGSAPYATYMMARCVEQLIEQLPITPIFDDDQYWELKDDGTGIMQNIRCSCLFKNKEGKAFYIDAIKFRDPDGKCYSNASAFISGVEIKSSQFIKGFPFIPITFIIDRSMVGGRETVTYPKQLDAVWRHYKQMGNTSLIIN